MAAAGALMGGLGQLLGGRSSSSGNTTSNSSSDSRSNNVQGSQTNSTNSSAAGSGNQAYGSVNQAMSPTLGYTANAGNMIGALLGVPSNNFYNNTPAPSVLPAMPSAGGGAASGHGGMIDKLFQAYVKSQAAAPTPTSPPPSTTPAGTTVPIGSVSGGVRDTGYLPNTADRREHGGPVMAGSPVVVGEKQPEVFVPHTSGTIVPSVPQGIDMLRTHIKPGHGGPGLPPVATPPIMAPPAATTPPAPTPWSPTPAPSPGGALDAFANSAGQQFVLGEGQKALSGASAANGTFDSGATGKALTQYGQNLGNTYLNDYMNHLFDYAKLGLGGASAMTGAGGVSQSVGSGGTNSSSIGYGNSVGTSDSSADSITKSKSKQGLGL